MLVLDPPEYDLVARGVKGRSPLSGRSFLQGLGVVVALDLDTGGCLVELGQVVEGELEVGGSEVLVQA